MKSVCMGMLAALIGVSMVQAGQTPLAPIPAPTFNITLGDRTACVTPSQSFQARAEGGAIDVQAGPGTLSAVLTGTVAANAHLGTRGAAGETYHLVQEFEITWSDHEGQVPWLHRQLDASTSASCGAATGPAPT